MAIGRILGACVASMALVNLAATHDGGTAHQQPLQVDAEADWATRHMAEEHHIGNFDPASFFTLHDYDDNGWWDTSEILKTYGMEDPSARYVSQEQKDKIVGDIMKMFDKNGNNLVEREEWMEVMGEGKGTLPDFGLGPGHHWDIEMEYEIHHWEKYHGEDTTEEDLTHPEDIEHFRLHDELEDEADRVAALDKLPIVEQNIPQKFRRDA